MQWYGQHQYYDIYIFNDVLNEKMQSQKDLPWIWRVCLELELLPSDVLELARITEEKMLSSLIQREEQRFWFSVWGLKIFTKVSQFSFLSFGNSLSPFKSQPHESVMEQLIYRWTCCGFRGENKWDFKPFQHTVPFLFKHSFRMLIWCKYRVWEKCRRGLDQQQFGVLC